MKNITVQFILKRTPHTYEDIYKFGVYKIYHIKYPNISYIGSAAGEHKSQIGFKPRWGCHLRSLRKNKHHSPFLQRIVNKYGIEGLRFNILEFCPSEMCIIREQYYLDALKPFGRNGYNTCKIAGSSLGYKMPEGRKTNRRPIDQYSLNGEFIKEWNSLADASRSLNINISSIKDCCKKRFKQIKGFIFRYKGEKDLPKSEEIRKNMIISCIFENKIMYSGTYSEIKSKIPDAKCTVYKFINSGKSTKNNWKYVKN